MQRGEAQRQGHVRRVLGRFRYSQLSRRDKGVVVRYLQHTSGYSRQHLMRLIGRFVARAPLSQRKPPVAGFYRRYTDADVRLLVQTDALHDTPSGLAAKHLFERAWQVYGDAPLRALGGHLRGAPVQLACDAALSECTRHVAMHPHWQGRLYRCATRATARIGRTGFIRIDSVHQGDQDGAKGVHHINAVDCVTQWEAVATCQKISEAYLLPVLEEMLAAFPVNILGVHADNGSEYINQPVAPLLNKLNVELTKSRPRRSTDNALAESKNGAVVRKVFGYGISRNAW